MKKRILSMLLASVMVSSMVAGCGSTATEVTGSESADTDTVINVEKEENATEIAQMDDNQLNGTTITFWHAMGGVNGEALDYLVNKFNTENEYGITVDSQYQGSYDDEINKLKSAQLGNMGADLVQVYDIGTRFMIDSGWIVSMQDLIDADGYDVSAIEPNIAAYYTVDNTLFSMPFNSSTPILYYNKDMFAAAGIEQAPASFSEIAAAGDALMSKGGAKEVISLGSMDGSLSSSLVSRDFPM